MAQELQSTTNQIVEAEARAPGKTSLLDELVDHSKRSREKDTRDKLRQGLEELLRHIVQEKDELEGEKKVDSKAVDRAIAAIDQKLSRQMDAILHEEHFKKLESAWRGLKYMVDTTNFRQNIRISVLHASKRELLDDFLEAPEVPQSGLYYKVYTQEYGQHGGEPYGAIIANYDFDEGAQDIELLRYSAAVAASAHAPFIAAASPKFFGMDSYDELAKVNELRPLMESAKYTAWRGFRDMENARYVGLTLPRFLLRLPYGKDRTIKSFGYEEKVTDNHQKYLWGNTAFAFASRITDSFARNRWYTNIIGPKGGGQVDQLPIHLYESLEGEVAKIPTEALIAERREFELANEGFITLTMRKSSDNACFFSANSARRPQTFPDTPEGKAAETNEKLGMQLPYVFIVSRLAHYLKVLQREELGTFKERADLENQLNKWIRQYIAEDDNAQQEVRARRPLRGAQIQVQDIPGQPGIYKVDMKVRPHIKYMGAFFTLSLVGKLDKKKGPG